ncbi:MAG: outer membrane beta-barrel protein [Spirosomataceae bacterium]
MKTVRPYTLCLILLLAIVGIEASAQNLRPLLLKLVEANQKPVIGATVKLSNRLDSTKVHQQIADTAGVVSLSVVDGQYLLRVTAVGMRTIEKGITVSDKQTSFRVVMEADAQTLNTVTVLGRKPLLRQEDDKTIVDPEPIASISTSAYEIMEKTPGLFLDQDGNVYLNSSTPATIYINGREQRMSTADIATVLRNLPPNSIEKIEILRTPSAKYDASGSGGVVNIVLKKGVKIGQTGSINAGMNQGRFGNQFFGLNLNNNDGKRTSYINLNINNRKSYDQLETNRKVLSDTLLSQKAYTTTPGTAVFLNYGLGFELSKKWDLNLDGRASYGLGQSSSENDNLIAKISTANLLSENLNLVQNDNNTFNLSQGVSTKYRIDTLGSEITSDFSYNLLGNHTNQDFNTQYIKPAKQSTGGDGEISNLRHLFAGQVDLKYKLPSKVTVEAGLKGTVQKFHSETNYYAIVADTRSPDLFRTNTFDYQDAITAGYTQLSRSFGKTLLKVGLRAEHTYMNGHQRIPRDTTFQINRTDLFPYVYLSRGLVKIAGYELRGYLIYRRSITRPVYEYLNPFPRYVDQYLYEAGNPSLKPQFTQNVEFNISVDERPILAFGKNYTQDIFTNVVYQDPRNPSVAYRTYDNLGKNEETYFRALGAIPPGGRYFFVVGAQFNYNQYNGLYEGKPLTFSRGSWSFFTFHQLKIDNRSTFTLNGFYRLKGQQQFYELGNFGGLNLSLNRYFLNRKLLITASLNDVFYTFNNTFTLNQGNIAAEGFRRSDTRRFGLNIRYNFGIKRKEDRANMFNVETEDGK